MNEKVAGTKPGDYPRLVWRIGVAMAEAGIRTNRALKKRLAEFNYHTSEAKLSRLRKVDLRAIELDLLAALCAALGTTPDQLLAPPGGWRQRIAQPASPKSGASPSAAEVGPQPINAPSPQEPTESPTASMLGPRIRPMNPMERATE
ncbi:helix-turn-helix domain-containing protein [bacterium BD-1]|nr:helix-turn-helix domain-containing protein [Ottowia caeni]